MKTDFKKVFILTPKEKVCLEKFLHIVRDYSSPCLSCQAKELGKCPGYSILGENSNENCKLFNSWIESIKPKRDELDFINDDDFKKSLESLLEYEHQLKKKTETDYLYELAKRKLKSYATVSAIYVSTDSDNVLLSIPWDITEL